MSCNHGCNGGQWSCRNGDCIAMSRYCDGVADCGDGKVSFLNTIGFAILQIPHLYQIEFFRFINLNFIEFSLLMLTEGLHLHLSCFWADPCISTVDIELSNRHK